MITSETWIEKLQIKVGGRVYACEKIVINDDMKNKKKKFTCKIRGIVKCRDVIKYEDAKKVPCRVFWRMFEQEAVIYEFSGSFRYDQERNTVELEVNADKVIQTNLDNLWWIR